MPMPIDLQVVFSKFHEYADNVGRVTSNIEAGRYTAVDKVHKESMETDKKVHNNEEYNQDFTKINPESKERQEAHSGLKKRPKHRPEETKPEDDHKSHLKEFGTGNIIDIID